MSTFDKDEQTIYKAFSQITVDTRELNKQIKNRLHEKIRNPKARKMRWSAVIAVAISAMFVVTVAASALGSFDWLLQQFNPSFGEIIEPVEVYCEDQGIRMEVIGAQKYGNMAIVYLSLQDISGQNRLTEQTAFRDGFGVKMNVQTQNGTEQGTEIAASFSFRNKVLYIDKESCTIYYEFNITADSNSPLSDQLEVGSRRIYFDNRTYEHEPISLSLSELAEIETIPLQESNVWGGSNDPKDFGGLTGALIPGYYGSMPHGEDDQWVSNAGIVNGKLHVQIGGIWNREFGSSDANLYIASPDGERIDPDYSVMLLADENYRLLNLNNDDYSDAVYKYDNFVFSVNTAELEGYALCYMGSVHSGVEGRWKVAAQLGDTSQQTRIWTSDISVEGHLFEHMFLSPLGLQVIGSYEGEECTTSEMPLGVETIDGVVIPLEGGGGSRDTQNQTFSLNWQTKTPLDVANVTAVIVDDTRIPVK